MSGLGKLRDTVAAINNLESPDAIRERAAQADRCEELDVLRAWQASRLEATYQDLLEQPRYEPACLFFLHDVYSANDFRQRDHEIKHLYEIMHRFLPDSLLALVKLAVELDDLTNTLDEALWVVMQEKLGVTDTVTPEAYAEGYRLCDNYKERAYQIELIVNIGHKVDFTTKIPMIATLLKLARRPVSRAGWGELHQWIVRGFTSFQHMHGARYFLDTIQTREMAILDRIFENDPQPFAPYLV